MKSIWALRAAIDAAMRSSSAARSDGVRLAHQESWGKREIAFVAQAKTNKNKSLAQSREPSRKRWGKKVKRKV